jgi:hypothetical protein
MKSGALVIALGLVGLPFGAFYLGDSRWPRFKWLGTGITIGMLVLPFSLCLLVNYSDGSGPLPILGIALWGIHMVPFDAWLPWFPNGLNTPTGLAGLLRAIGLLSVGASVVWALVYGLLGGGLDLFLNRRRSG